MTPRLASTASHHATPPPPPKPRLLFVVTLAEVGGVASYSTQLLPGLTERFDVRVAAHGDGPLKDAAEALGIPFIPLQHMRRNLSPAKDIMAMAELVKIMRKQGIDLVHAHSSKAGILARTAAALARVPVRIFTVHGWAFAAYSGLTSTAFRLADRAMRPLTTTVVSPSEEVMRQGVAARTCSPERTVVIPNAVDTRRYSASRTPSDPVRILSVGRLAFPKDFTTLNRAIADLDGPFVAAVAGDGPERSEREAEAAALGIAARIEFLGTRHDVPELLGAADIFVLSSRSECLPMSIIEAMAAGAAVVASDVGGVPELVVDEKTGILVRPGDPEALTAALARLIHNPELRREMGEAGRRRARELFDVELLRERHVSLYVDALAAKGVPVP